MREDCAHFDHMLDFANRLGRRQELERLFRNEICQKRLRSGVEPKVVIREHCKCSE